MATNSVTFAESREIISRNGGAHDALGLRQRRVVFFGAGENDALRFAARASSRKLSGFLARPISSATMSLLALVSNEVRPERGKSLRCRFRGQTLGGRTELFQQFVRFCGRGIDQPLSDRGLAMVVS
jgi:hypothetical protein